MQEIIPTDFIWMYKRENYWWNVRYWYICNYPLSQAFKLFLVLPVRSFPRDSPLNRWACLTTHLKIHVYNSLHLFYAIRWHNQQMQLHVVNFISLLRSLYMFRVPYTPIIRSTIFQLYLQPLVQTIVSSELLAASVTWYKIVLLMMGVYGTRNM